MTPDPIAYCATPGTHVGFVVVGRKPTRLAPSSALPTHAPDAARYGAGSGVTAR